MKKLLLPLLLFALVGCEHEVQIEPIEDEPLTRYDYIGTYLVSGKSDTLYGTTNEACEKQTIIPTGFYVPMKIEKDPYDVKKLIIKWTPYPVYKNTTATIANDGTISIENTQHSFVDDGRILSKGSSVLCTIYYPHNTVLKDSILEFTTIKEITATDSTTGAVLHYNEVIKNTAVKQ